MCIRDSVKILSILFLPYALLKLDGGDRVKYAVAFAAVALAPILIMPSAFVDMMRFQMSWSLENSWYIYIFPDAATPLTLLEEPPLGVKAAKILGYALMLLLYIHVLGLELPPERFMAFASATYLLTTPRYSPQTSILLLPFLPFVMTPAMIPGFLLWETANASIILTWFTTDVPHLPWQPPQIASLIRSLALLVMFIQMEVAVRGFGIRISGMRIEQGLRKVREVVSRLVG